MGPADELPAQELTIAGHGGARAPSGALPALPAPYQIERLIAQGGMGRIYRALDTDLDRAVAIKVPKSSSPGLLRRFEREVAITARLQHPGIVPIHGSGRLADGTPFYVMRFVEGTPLDAAVTRANDLAQRLALVPHLVTVAATMGYVHGERVAHRDLKPNNILIGRFGETVIIDWGLAKRLEESPRPSLDDVSSLSEPLDAALDETSSPLSATTRAGDVLGTPSFMSPEQASGKPIDARADVYAIGVMLAFVVTGRIGDVDDDPAWRDPAAAPLVAVQRRATAATIDDRYADGTELADALRAVLGRRAEPVVKRSPWPRRALLATAVLALGGVAAGVALRSRAAHTAAAHLERMNVSRDDLVNIALSPSGHRLATISLDRIEIRDLVTGRTWSRPAWIAWPAQMQFESEDVVDFAARDSRIGARERSRWDLANDTLTSRGALDDSIGPWVGAIDGGDLFFRTHPARPVVRVGGAEPTPFGLGRYPVGLIAIAPSRRMFAFVDPIDLVHVVIRVVEPKRDRVIESPPLEDVGALTWTDDDTLLYANGSNGASVLWRATATVAGLASPTRLYTHEAPDQWIGAVAARGGRLFVSVTSSAFDARVLDVETKRIEPLQATDAAAVLGWHDATTLLTWNRGTSAIERRSLDSAQLPAVTSAWFRGDPANATTAGDVMVIAQRGQNGRTVAAVDATTGSTRWQSDGGKLWFVRCAGDHAVPCIAGARTSEGLIELRSIDPATGDLGDVVVAAANIIDAAIDAKGTRLAWIVDNAQLHTRALEATGEGDVFGNFTSAHSLAFVADRDELVLGGGTGGRGISLVRGHDVTPLVVMPNELVSLVRASPDGSRVSYRARALTSQLAELRP